MRRLTVLLTGSLLVAACGGGSNDAGSPTESAVTTEAPATDPPATDPPATEPTPTEPTSTEPPASDPPATEAPEPELAPFTPFGDGPYQVGVQTITVTDAERERPLTVDVTFPLLDGTDGTAHRYAFVTGDYYESPRAISATPDQVSPDGPFPLVVYTHGSGGLRYIHSDYTETLASYGYVVVAADHAGNTAIDQFLDTQDDRATIAYNRPRDVQVLIDSMLDPESLETVGFVASVNPEQIAVTGHSLGGYASFAVVSGMSNEAGTLEGDTRIDAIIPLAPALGPFERRVEDVDGEVGAEQEGDATEEASRAPLLDAAQLARVEVPTLVMVGTDDKSTPPTPNVDRAVAETSSDVVYRVDLVAAEHQSFSDVCDYLDFFPQLENPTPAVVKIVEGFAVAACSEGDMPTDRVQEITNTFAVSFLDSIFRDGEMITPANTELPDDVIETVK